MARPVEEISDGMDTIGEVTYSNKTMTSKMLVVILAYNCVCMCVCLCVCLCLCMCVYVC